MVSEDDLRVEDPTVGLVMDARAMAAVARAEWFVSDWHTVDGSVAARDHAGGTAPRQVRLAAEAARSLLAARSDTD